MPTYKLTYFDVRALGETARMLFKLAGVQFEDRRIKNEEWGEMKAKTPMGQLPLLEIDGVEICQSNAINRYLAREFGFAGKDSLEMARADMVVDSVVDILSKVRPMYDLQGEELTAYEKKFGEEFFEPHLRQIEKMLLSNANGDGFFVGDKITWADLVFVNVFEYVTKKSKGEMIFEKFPKLVAHKARVLGEPKIAEWIKERPVTSM